MSRMRTAALWTLGLVAWALTAQAEPPTLHQFAQHLQFTDVQVSPNGKYLAARFFDGESYAVAIFTTADRKMVSRFVVGGENDVGHIDWAGPERLLISPQYTEFSEDNPMLTGELIGINANGKDSAYLFGQRAIGERLGTRLPTVQRRTSSAMAIRTLPEDPKHVLIEVEPLVRGTDAPWHAYLMDVYSGALSKELEAPVPGPIEFFADRTGRVRYGTSYTDDMTDFRSFYRKSDDNAWWPVSPDSGDRHTGAVPLSLSQDGRRVLLSHEGSEGHCLAEQAIEGGPLKTLLCDRDGAIDTVIHSFDDAEPIAVLLGGDRPQLRYIAPNHPHAQSLAALQASFKDSIVLPWSHSQDGRKVVLKVYSDRDPGLWYLYDSVDNTADLLFPSHGWLYPEDMGTRRAVRFKSGDGFEVHGFLTTPPGYVAGSTLPTVVNVHGGPLAIHDEWSWSGEAQLLATRGYAVLEVNYRGSGGYGRRYRDAGWGQASRAMIDDVTAGARWAIAQGIATPDGLCIMGASYGGYAAVESAVREPTLYRCAVARSGFYNIPALIKYSDLGDVARTRAYLLQLFTQDPAVQRAGSPINRLDALKIPLLLVHGEHDARTPASQFEALRKALDEGEHAYETLVFSGEGHSLYSPKNREVFYTRLLDFLDRHIGAHSKTAAKTKKH